jgi:hypothetical protein
MIDPAKVCLYIPPGLKRFKLDLFERIGGKIEKAGGRVVRHKAHLLDELPREITPIVGCMPDCAELIEKWRKEKRQWIYWDRGYARRVFATWLPRGENGGYYRWHIGSFQMQSVADVSSDRWDALKIPIKPWRPGGDKIVIADTLSDYWDMRGLKDWAQKTAHALRQYTKRPIIVRHKESKIPLDQELSDAHCLVAHGSIAAVESAIMGCPVFCDSSCAAAIVGETDFSRIDHPRRPERDKWAHALAYCQFNEQELVDGTLWKLIA